MKLASNHGFVHYTIPVLYSQAMVAKAVSFAKNMYGNGMSQEMTLTLPYLKSETPQGVRIYCSKTILRSSE